jgi:hypothetical protein
MARSTTRRTWRSPVAWAPRSARPGARLVPPGRLRQNDDRSATSILNDYKQLECSWIGERRSRRLNVAREIRVRGAW